MNSKQEDFELWIAMLPERIQDFKQSLPIEISSKLDTSIDSLNIIEKHLLDNYTFDTIREEINASFYDGCARYIGDTFCHNVKGAYWSIETENKNSMFHNIPVIMVRDTDTFAVCPLTMTTTLLDRKIGTFLSSITTNYQQEPRIKS
jgi:hypothetical protein